MNYCLHRKSLVWKFIKWLDIAQEEHLGNQGLTPHEHKRTLRRKMRRNFPLQHYKTGIAALTTQKRKPRAHVHAQTHFNSLSQS